MPSSTTPSPAEDDDFLSRVDLRLVTDIVGYKLDDGHPADRWVDYYLYGTDRPSKMMTWIGLRVRTLIRGCLEGYPEESVPAAMRSRLGLPTRD